MIIINIWFVFIKYLTYSYTPTRGESKCVWERLLEGKVAHAHIFFVYRYIYIYMYLDLMSRNYFIYVLSFVTVLWIFYCNMFVVVVVLHYLLFILFCFFLSGSQELGVSNKCACWQNKWNSTNLTFQILHLIN